jgi:hypothetical protein
MAVRSSMAAIIARVRLKIFDPAGANQVFADQTIQDILDDNCRQDIYNMVLAPKPTFVSGTIQWLDYLAGENPVIGDWEDDAVLKQFLINVVTPSLAEPITGHWQFAATTLPPVYISGKTYDIYRASADLLEMRASTWALSYNVTVDGQTLHREGVMTQLQNLAKTYRTKQRVSSFSFQRSDLRSPGETAVAGIGPLEIDYMSKG